MPNSLAPHSLQRRGHLQGRRHHRLAALHQSQMGAARCRAFAASVSGSIPSTLIAAWAGVDDARRHLLASLDGP